MNHRRGHESVAHRAAKGAIRALFSAPRWTVLVEYRCCDLLVLDTWSGLRLAIEVERSIRNLGRNAQRNFAAGCGALAIVDGVGGELARLERAVERLPPGTLKERIQIFALNPEGLQQLLAWAETLAEQLGGHSSS